MALVVLSDIAGFNPINIGGVLVNRDEPVEIPTLQALFRCSDKNFLFTFNENDKEELTTLDTELFPSVSLELGKEITTHNELVKLLIPAKTSSKKKVAPKSSKSSLNKE